MVEWKKLGEVCLLKARIGWQGLTQKEHRTTGEYLLVTGTDFTSNYEVDFEHCVYVDEERYTQDPNIQLRENDVLITKDGTLGKMAVIEDLPKPATLNGGLFVIRDLTGKIHHKYLLHYMLSSKFQSIIESNHTNGTIKHLTQALLTNFPIPIPSLEKQLEIVRILDTFTSSIENLKEQIAQRRKQYEYYRDQLLDLEGKEGVERLALKEVCEVINGRAYSQPELLSDGKYRVLRVGNFFSNDSWYYSDLELENKYYCEKGDLLYAWSASFGPHIWEEEKVIYHYHIWKMDCGYRLNKKYMYYWLQSDDMKKQAFTNIHGATMAHLTKALMEALQVPVPSLQEQQRIVSILDTFEASIQNLEAQLKEREKQYEYYRNKLLTFE